MLGPVSSHAAAETRQVVASLGSQPKGGRAFWRPPTGPRDATSNTRTSASDRHSGQSGAASPVSPKRLGERPKCRYVGAGGCFLRRSGRGLARLASAGHPWSSATTRSSSARVEGCVVSRRSVVRRVARGAVRRHAAPSPMSRSACLERRSVAQGLTGLTQMRSVCRVRRMTSCGASRRSCARTALEFVRRRRATRGSRSRGSGVTGSGCEVIPL